MKSNLLSTVALLGVVLAVCTTPVSGAPTDPQHTKQPPAPLSEPPKIAPPSASVNDPDEPPPPVVELTPQTLFQILAAELASQRGEIGAAWSTYMSLARTTRDARLARRATELASNARALEQAHQSAQLWTELAPRSETAQQALELLRLTTGHLSALEPTFAARLAQARQAGTLDTEYPLLQRQLLRSRDRQAAWSMLQRLSAPDLGITQARLTRAEIAAAADDITAAHAEAHAVLTLSPRNEAAAVLAARSAWRTPANQAQALEELSLFVAQNPQANEARYIYARMLLERHEWGAARAHLEQLRGQIPNSPAVLFSLAQLAWRQQQPQHAENYLKDLLALPRSTPRDDTPAFLFLAQLAEERGQTLEATEWLSKVTAPDEVGPATLRRAMLLNKLGRIDEALAAARQTSVRTPREATLKISTVAGILRDAQRHEEALAVLKEGLTSHPDQPDLLYDAAMTAERLDRMDEAERILRRLIELRPDHAHALNALGYSLADRNLRLPEARKLIEQALNLAPDDAQIIDSMGWVLFRMRDYAGALVHLRRAHAVQPDPEIAAHLAEVLWVTGQHEEARHIWRAALTAFPDNAVLRATISRLDATP